jgi:hypothetical protein
MSPLIAEWRVASEFLEMVRAWQQRKEGLGDRGSAAE